MERWNGIGGNELSRLITNPRFPRRPNKARKIARLVSPVNKGNNYGLKLRTYFMVRALLEFLSCEIINILLYIEMNLPSQYTVVFSLQEQAAMCFMFLEMTNVDCLSVLIIRVETYK